MEKEGNHVTFKVKNQTNISPKTKIQAYESQGQWKFNSSRYTLHNNVGPPSR